VTAKEVQNGVGINCRPIECSLAAANIDQVRIVVKKARQEVDNEQVNLLRSLHLSQALKNT